jgi:hypothetical protein
MRNIKMCFVTLYLFSLAFPSFAYDWDIQTVDWEGNVGVHVSMDLDSSGKPHIAHFESLHGTLKYSYLSASGWNHYTIDNSFDSGWYPSIALGTNDNVHISYLSNGSLKYASNKNSNWTIETVDAQGRVGWDTSLALDRNGEPHISYRTRTPPFDLKYAFHENNQWQTEFLTTTDTSGGRTALAMDSSDNVSIVYGSGISGLNHAYFANDHWSYESFPQFSSGYPSACYDNNGNLHVSYLGFQGNYLGYGFWNGSTWTFQTVDSIPVEVTTSITVDTSGNPYISYYDKLNTALKFAYWNGQSWYSEIVDSSANVGRSNSIAIDAMGTVHIAYSDVTNWDLKYATTTIPEPTTLSLLALGAIFMKRRNYR